VTGEALQGDSRKDEALSAFAITGNVAAACRIVEIDRRTFYTRLKMSVL